GDAGEPSGQKDHERNDRRTEQELPMRGDRRIDLLQRDKRERADGGTVKTALSAENQHQQDIARLVPGKQLRIDETELQRRKVAREPGQRTGNREARELV